MSTNTGGPAFARPATLYPSNRPASTEQTGMTIRDYFIAHAPEHPQPWFKPVMPPKPDSTICVSDDGQRFYDDKWAAEKVEGDDGFQRVNQAEMNQWESDYIKQKFVQWPAAWADEQLKARTK